MARNRRFDVLVVGGGPAGIAAACAAARSGRRVAVVDDNPTLGGQAWRDGKAPLEDRRAAIWLQRFARAGADLIGGTTVVAQPRPGLLLAETDHDAIELVCEKLIVATGARERLLPFPGWTLPGVTGAGGLQSLVKGGLPIEGKRVAVAGSGPLLLAVAAYLQRRGAVVCLVAEQSSRQRLARFGRHLLGSPRKLIEGAGYAIRLLLKNVPYKTSCWPLAAEGDDKPSIASSLSSSSLKSVAFRAGSRTWTEPCDYLACGFGLVASVELPLLLGCRVTNDVVMVDQWQETTVPGVYAAGETTGIGGLEAALVEGRIAGYAAVGRREEAARLFARREKTRRFAAALERAFALRDELKELATPETLVCRCEDVPRGQLQRHASWREAKLQTRCGMGACQGRVCGEATEFLFGWKPESVRPPLYPTRLETLADDGE